MVASAPSIEPLIDIPFGQLHLKRFSLVDYHRLRDLGLLSRHSELLYGVIVEKMTISPKHRHILHQLRRLLDSLLPSSLLVFQESPLALGTSEPEPDLAIISGTWEDYRDSHPTTALWVIEIAISSIAMDLSKQTLYAEAKIPFYWIIEPEAGKIHIFSEPEGQGYKNKQVFEKTQDLNIPVGEKKAINLEWI